jgi:ABC-type Fe3+-hydroxamate transport system substrate-binding protein
VSFSQRVTDDRKRVVELAGPARRIVSLVPSDTLNVAALGCGAALVGRTDYCHLPADVVARVPSVGGTKNPRLDDIVALEPDLVIGNQEENTRSDLEALAQRGVRVYVAFPKRVADGLSHLARLARLFGVARDPAVRQLLKRGYDAHHEAEQARAKALPLRVFCPIWMDPLMTIHGDTFISDMLDLCGAQNVFADRSRRYPLAADLGRAAPLPPEKVAGRDARYPRITLEEVVARAPDLVVLPDEPHPFTAADAEVFRALAIPAVRRGAIVPTDGKDLCWYGARSVEGIARVRALIAAAASAPSL